MESRFISRQRIRIGSGYSLEDFHKSVVEGQHPDGDELDTNMPRWQMNDQDLSDLFAFLKTIPK